MELYITILTLATVLSTSAEVEHEAFQFTMCSDTEEEYYIGNDEEFYIGYDDEELWHADFKEKRGVNTVPDVTEQITFPGFYEAGVSNVVGCKRNLPVFAYLFKSIPQVADVDAPQTSIYPKNIVQLGVQNTLVCHVTGFFPPSVNISWTKNNVNITEDISVSQYRPQKDRTYNIFSTLKFTPAEGDIYSCTVTHEALQGQPQTKLWDVEGAVPSVAPAVFCAVGLILGLVGVAMGTFFIVKGNNCN